MSVGKIVPRKDAWIKANGEAQYSYDIHYPNELQLTIIRSTHPHARAQTERLLTNRKLSQELVKEAGDLVQRECVPIDDIRSNKEYREAMVGVLLQKYLHNIY